MLFSFVRFFIILWIDKNDGGRVWFMGYIGGWFIKLIDCFGIVFIIVGLFFWDNIG